MEAQAQNISWARKMDRVKKAKCWLHFLLFCDSIMNNLTADTHLKGISKTYYPFYYIVLSNPFLILGENLGVVPKNFPLFKFAKVIIRWENGQLRNPPFYFFRAYLCYQKLK